METRVEERRRATDHGTSAGITGAGTLTPHLVYGRFGGRAGAEGIGGIFVERGHARFRIDAANS